MIVIGLGVHKSSRFGLWRQVSIPLISAVAVSLLAELWTCNQRHILYIVFIRVTISIYSDFGGSVGTYSEDKQDYRLFCPDERHQLFP